MVLRSETQVLAPGLPGPQIFIYLYFKVCNNIKLHTLETQNLVLKMLPSSLLSTKISRIKWSLSMCHINRLAGDTWTGSSVECTFKFYTKNAVNTTLNAMFQQRNLQIQEMHKAPKTHGSNMFKTKDISKLGKVCNTFMKVSFLILTSLKTVRILSYKFIKVTRWTLSLCIPSFCNIFSRTNSFITKPHV